MHWPDPGGKCKRSCTDEAVRCQHRSIQSNPRCSPPIMFSGSNRRRGEYGHPLPSFPVHHFVAVRYLPSPMPHFSLNNIEYSPPIPFAQHSKPVHFSAQAQCIPLFEGNAPFQEETKSGLHWVAASFHYNKVPFGNRSQLIRCHQGSLHHLQGLAGIILALAHRARLYSAGAEVLGQHFGCLAAWRKTAKDSILTVVLNDLAALLAIVLFKLSQRLDDRHQGQPSGAPGGE